MNVQPFVSIIPSYNEQDDIEETVIPAANLSNEHKKIIIVDDSTDQALDIIKKLSTQYVFSVYRQKNRNGLNGAYNLRIKLVFPILIEAKEFSRFSTGKVKDFFGIHMRC